MTGCPNNRLRLLWVSLAAVVLAACGHSSKPTAKPSPTTSASISTTTTVAPDAAVIAAWRRYWDVYLAVGSDIHMPDARLATVATGDELKQLGSTFLAAQSGGQVLQGTIDLAPKVTSVTQTDAVLQDCYFSHIVVADRATGKPVGAQRSDRTLVTASLVVDGGSWKVSSIRHDGDGCTAGS